MAANIAIFTTYFDLCGFLTGYTCSSNYHRFACFTLILHMGMATFLTFQLIRLTTFMYGYLGVLGAINDSSQCVCLLITYWTILIESFANRKAQRFFWSGYVQLNDSSHIASNILNHFELFSLSIYYSAILIVEVCLLGIPPDVLLPYCILYAIVQTRVFYQLFCVRLITAELGCIDHELGEMVQTLENDRARIELAMKETRRKHRIGHELVNQINDNFSFSTVATILSQFYLIYANTNWLYIQDDENFDFLIAGMKNECAKQTIIT